MSKNFKEIFEIEIKCWCYGLEKVDETVDASVLHKVIKEFSPVMKEALQHNYEFDIVDVATKFVTAAKSKYLLRETVYYIGSQLPAPFELKEEEKIVLESIINKAESRYQGLNSRYDKKWANLNTSSSSLDALSFPPKPARAN